VSGPLRVWIPLTSWVWPPLSDMFHTLITQNPPGSCISCPDSLLSEEPADLAFVRHHRTFLLPFSFLSLIRRAACVLCSFALFAIKKDTVDRVADFHYSNPNHTATISSHHQHKINQHEVDYSRCHPGFGSIGLCCARREAIAHRQRRQPNHTASLRRQALRSLKR
jgi:hypothetical protein